MRPFLNNEIEKENVFNCIEYSQVTWIAMTPLSGRPQKLSRVESAVLGWEFPESLRLKAMTWAQWLMPVIPSL